MHLDHLWLSLLHIQESSGVAGGRTESSVGKTHLSMRQVGQGEWNKDTPSHRDFGNRGLEVTHCRLLSHLVWGVMMAFRVCGLSSYLG